MVLSLARNIDFNGFWTAAELAVFQELNNPAQIQAFLDTIPYSEEPIYRSPRSVLRDRKAHCFDGALFAAAALRRLGYPPRIVDLLAVRDDDHILAVFKDGRHWGAVAKSNFVGLRYREPIHLSLRELVMTYFEAYYNVEREKTLRRYTIPLNLATLDSAHWMTLDSGMDRVAERLDQIRSVPIITAEMAERLLPLDERSYQAGLMGANAAGLYRPPSS